MSSRGLSIAVAVGLAVSSCSGKSEEEEPPPAPVFVVPADAAIDGITEIGEFDPESGLHVDDDNPGERSTTKRPARGAPPIGIMLKSEPTGARVFVDGTYLGETPKYWTGAADGQEREFAFTMPKHALARYRFVPITNGTLHATLQRIGGSEPHDGGLDPYSAPTQAPDAAIAPPKTIVSPPDAAPPRPPRVDPDAASTPTPDASDQP